MAYQAPGQPGSIVSFSSKYDNFIGGKWLPPVEGEYLEAVSPVTGRPFAHVPRSRAADVDLALDAAHAAAPRWGRTSTTERSRIRLKIA